MSWVCASVPRMEKVGHTQERGTLLRLTEAAALIQVHPDTLRRWTNAGKITAYRTPGGHRRYRADDVRALMGAA